MELCDDVMTNCLHQAIMKITLKPDQPIDSHYPVICRGKDQDGREKLYWVREYQGDFSAHDAKRCFLDGCRSKRAYSYDIDEKVYSFYCKERKLLLSLFVLTALILGLDSCSVGAHRCKLAKSEYDRYCETRKSSSPFVLTLSPAYKSRLSRFYVCRS